MLRFAFKTATGCISARRYFLHQRPAAVTNVLGVLKVVTMNLAVTLSFALTLLFHGFAIFSSMLDIRPIALADFERYVRQLSYR